MMFSVNGNAVWQLVTQSDLVTKLVLFIMLVMSIACWTVFLYKMIVLTVKKRQMTKMLHCLHDVTGFEQMRVVVASMADTLPGYFLKKNLITLKTLLEHHSQFPHLSDKENMLLQQEIEQQVAILLEHEEAYVPTLFVCASVAPLLGLFGTIWGLVHSFVRIAQQQSADITTVAPGIAEALITTLAGLIVAIPALVMYHFIVAQIRQVEGHLNNLAHKFFWIVQQVFVVKDVDPLAPAPKSPEASFHV